jgi:inosose dehydratase
MAIRVACQTYTWEMLGDQWQGRVTDILDWVSDAGYAGIEITNSMIKEFYDRPSDFADELKKRNLELSAFAYATPTGFTDPDLWSDYMAGAIKALKFLKYFPNPRLAMGGVANPSRENAREKLDRAIKFYNKVGQLATVSGIAVNVHPHSHHGSLLESAMEYQYLLDRLDPIYVSFGPDTGHIVRGGQDLLTCLKTHIHRITHLHIKDATATRDWATLGEGICDFPAVFDLLNSVGYDGWLVAEEESEFARLDGISAIRKNRNYLRLLGY